MTSLLNALMPWEFSPTVLVACVTAGGLYVRGCARLRASGRVVGLWRGASFFAGLTLVYAVLQTRYDYLAQHVFWVHRVQHLVLHHLGPFLIVLATPHEVMGRGLPERLRRRALQPLWRSAPVRRCYRAVQQPWMAAALFVGLIFFWLTPRIHLYAMLSAPLYNLMNWGMVVDGLLFWWLIVDPRPVQARTAPGYTTRIVMLWLVMLPQIALGAYIALCGHDLYAIYGLCGRPWPISPMTDQQLGGLITWIPAAMMSVVGGLVVLRLWVRAGAGGNTGRWGPYREGAARA